MTTFWKKSDARENMLEMGATKYRVKEGQVHFYGIMPNSNTRGWYTAGYASF